MQAGIDGAVGVGSESGRTCGECALGGRGGRQQQAWGSGYAERGDWRRGGVGSGAWKQVSPRPPKAVSQSVSFCAGPAPSPSPGVVGLASF